MSTLIAFNPLDETDTRVLELLQQAAAVTMSRKTSEAFRRRTIDNAMKVCSGVAVQNHEGSWSRLAQVYDANAETLQAIELQNDPAEWSETQKWIRR